MQKKKIEELSEKAKTTIGVKFCLDSFSLQIKMLIEQISFIEKQVESIKEDMSTIMTKLDSPITTIPGIRPVIGAIILGELGDISRFSNASKIVAYAGLDSVVSQSGNYEAKSMSISKRGSSYLRRTLF